MVFWQKGKTGKIKKELKKLGKKVRKLEKRKAKIDKSKKILQKCIELLDHAEKDINVRRDKEKKKPFIDKRSGSKLDKMAEKECRKAENLKEKLEEYLGMLDIVKTEKDMEEVLGMIKEETDKIIQREESNKRAISEMERDILAERLRVPTVEIPPLSTKDGVPFSYIVKVSKQLGAEKITAGKKHRIKIHMPNGKNFVLSPDCGSQLSAKQLHENLIQLLPKDKVPTVKEINDALRRGDIRAA